MEDRDAVDFRGGVEIADHGAGLRLLRIALRRHLLRLGVVELRRQDVRGARLIGPAVIRF
jgi:hypothetical protein